MPYFQIHIVRADNNENVRQPIVQAADENEARGIRLRKAEAIGAVTPVNEEALKRDYPNGHPFEVAL